MVPKMKIPLTARESENPTIQMEEHSDSYFCDRQSATILKMNLEQALYSLVNCNNDTFYMKKNHVLDIRLLSYVKIANDQ